MRVTYNQQINTMLEDIRRHQEDIYRSQQVISTGKEVEKPSDDPVRARRIFEIDDELSRLGQYQQNLAHTRSNLQFAESELQLADDLFVEARALAVQGSTETTSPEDRIAIAERIDHILHEFASISNARRNGTYIFGGFNTREAPYQLIEDPANGQVIRVQDLPQGMDGIIQSIIGDDDKIQSNIPGTEIFQIGEPGDEGDAFQVLIDLRDALNNNDTAGIQESLDRIDGTSSRIRSIITKIGGMVQRLDSVDVRLENMNILYNERLQNEEEADLTEWIKAFELQRIALQSTMQIGTQVITTSLLNFIR